MPAAVASLLGEAVGTPLTVAMPPSGEAVPPAEPVGAPHVAEAPGLPVHRLPVGRGEAEGPALPDAAADSVPALAASPSLLLSLGLRVARGEPDGEPLTDGEREDRGEADERAVALALREGGGEGVSVPLPRALAVEELLELGEGEGRGVFEGEELGDGEGERGGEAEAEGEGGLLKLATPMVPLPGELPDGSAVKDACRDTVAPLEALPCML